MAFQSGFDFLEANNTTFAQWLTSHNSILNEFRNTVMTAANGSYSFTDGDARLNGTFVANTLFVIDGPAQAGLSGGEPVLSNGDVVDIQSANLYITSNTTFTSNADLVTIENDLIVDGQVTISEANLIYKLVPDNYDDLVPNLEEGRALGNTSNLWDGYFRNIEADIIEADSIIIPANGTIVLPSTLNFSGTTNFEDVNVTGTASFANLEVSNLITNTAAIIGTNGVVDSTVPTLIDDFDKEVSKGFKYIIHGQNDDSDSAYAIEINCSHNSSNVFFTRFGEVSNNFDCNLTVQINGPNVELIANCPSADVSNIHSFSIVRIETR